MKGAGSPSTEVSPKNLAPKQWLVYTTSDYIVFEILGLGPTVQQMGSIFK